MASPDRTRSTTLRVFVVWGLGVFLLVVLGTGLVYRYVAFRWWPALVVKTTPSIEHLLDCYQSTRNPDDAEIVSERLQDLLSEGRPVLLSVARRLADRRIGSEDIFSFLNVVAHLNLQSDADYRIAWNMVVPYVMHHDEMIRYQALHCLVNIADDVDGADDVLLAWTQNHSRHHFPSRFSRTNISNFDPFVRMLRRQLQRKEQREQIWQGLMDGLYSDDPAYLQEALKSVKNDTALPDPLVDLLEAAILDGHWVGMLLWQAHLPGIDAKRLMQFAHAHPEHRRSVWVALCRHPTVGQLGDLSPYREWWGDWLHAEDPETAVFILTVLGDHPHPSYRSDIESMLSARDPTLRRLAVVAVSIINWEGADTAVLRAVFDPECSGMALRALPAVIGPDTLRHLEAMEGVDRSSEAYRLALAVCQDHRDATETPEPASR